MTNSIIARYPVTTSGRAAALGALDRAGLDATSLIEAGDELLIQQFDYPGDEAQAKAEFGESVEWTDHSAPPKKLSKKEQAALDAQADFPTAIEVGGQVLPVPAQARESQAAPEIGTIGGTPPQDTGAPDSADAGSAHLSGAAQAQASADKANLAEPQA